MLTSMLANCEGKLVRQDVDNKSKCFVIVYSGAFVILWICALRGGEIFMLEAREFVNRRDDGS